MISASRLVPYAFARDNAILLVPKSERDAEVWISDATPLAALNEVIRVFPGKVKPIVVEPGKLVAAISQTYGDQGGSAQQIVGDIEGEFDITRLMQDIPKIEDLLETEDDAPIIRMINALLTQALRDGASDIHIEPFESYSMVRFRVDGTLRDVVEPRARAARGAGVAHQDHGAARHRGEAPAAGRPHHVARSAAGRWTCASRRCRPGTASAWCCACSTRRPGGSTWRKLGMAERLAGAVRPADRSSRTASCWSPARPAPARPRRCTRRCRGSIRARTNIMTVEDPIEYDLDGIGQTQVNARIDMTFAQGAARDPAPGSGRGHDRRDPRPRDRADRGAGVADRPLVLATLHTNDAVAP